MKGLLQSVCRIIINRLLRRDFISFFPDHFQIRTSNWTERSKKQEIYPKSRKIRKQAVECMGDIGHNGASRSENIQKQATAEEIQEAMMRKMDIKK